MHRPQERVAHYERERGQALYQQSLDMGAGVMSMRPGLGGFPGVAAGPNGASTSSSALGGHPAAREMGGARDMLQQQQQPFDPYAPGPSRELLLIAPLLVFKPVK